MHPRPALDGDGRRRTITRIHGTSLVVISTVAIIVATAGWQDAGPYSILANQPLGYLGLFQAYMFMILVAVVALLGSTRRPGRTWNWLLLVAHVPPLAAIAIGYDIVVATDQERIAVASFVIHVPLMALEVFALLWKAPLIRR